MTVPRVLGLAFAVFLGWYTFIGGPQLAATSVPESRFTFAPPPPAAELPLFPVRGKVFLGVHTRAGVEDFTDEVAFAEATGTQPAVYEFSQGWAVDEFSPRILARAAARGMLPMVSWEPWDFRDEPHGDRGRSDQPDYRLARIIAGDYDDYIRTWADGIARAGYPVAIRLAHEMNGYWYPWSEQSNGNKRGEYVQMWRHVHDIFTAAGARNVIWVWSPNVVYNDAPELEAYYPGDSYVDWIGVSGYYGTGSQREFLSFDQVFGSTLRGLTAISSRPIVITETGATDVTGRRADWIRDMFRSLPGHPEIIGVIWFEASREIDWRIAGTPEAARAFGEGARDPRYDTPWSPYSRPMTSTEPAQ